MWDLSSLQGIGPMSSAVEAQNLNHWTACEVPCFLLFSSLEFGAHSPVVMSGPQCPYISQPIYPKSTDVPICTDGSVSVELIPWEHAHILMDTVINENTLIKTCVLNIPWCWIGVHEGNVESRKYSQEAAVLGRKYFKGDHEVYFTVYLYRPFKSQ